MKIAPVDLKYLSDVVDNEVVKNTEFSTLKTKINYSDKKILDATTLIHINQYNIDKQNLEKKKGDVGKEIPDTSGSVTTTILNTKTNEVEKKIPNTSSSGITNVLNTTISEFKNKIPDNSKSITTQEVNKLTAESFVARLKQADLVSKTDFHNKLTSFNNRITSIKTKHL